MGSVGMVTGMEEKGGGGNITHMLCAPPMVVTCRGVDVDVMGGVVHRTQDCDVTKKEYCVTVIVLDTP
jgi:hypothetical protein